MSKGKKIPKSLKDIPKSPAVLLYTKDFFTDTYMWTPAQVGHYIRALCVQHFNHEHLLMEDLLKIIGGPDPKILEKFEQDNEGRYFNPRMEAEVLKRGVYRESRNPGLAHLYEANLKRQEGKEVRRFVPPSPEEVQAYCDERKNGISGVKFCAFYTRTDWKVKSGGKMVKMKDWKAAVHYWEERDAKEKKLLLTKGTHESQKHDTGTVKPSLF